MRKLKKLQTQSRLDLVYEPDQNVFFVTDDLGNISDLEVDFSKEERACEVVSQLTGNKYIFTEKVSNFPEIYKHFQKVPPFLPRL